jgi:hypothetical protein
MRRRTIGLLTLTLLATALTFSSSFAIDIGLSVGRDVLPLPTLYFESSPPVRPYTVQLEAGVGMGSHWRGALRVRGSTRLDREDHHQTPPDAYEHYYEKTTMSGLSGEGLVQVVLPVEVLGLELRAGLGLGYWYCVSTDSSAVWYSPPMREMKTTVQGPVQSLNAAAVYHASNRVLVSLDCEQLGVHMLRESVRYSIQGDSSVQRWTAPYNLSGSDLLAPGITLGVTYRL